MSYALEFYTASYKDLHGEILKPSEDFLQKLRENWQKVYAPAAGESFEDALDAGLSELRKGIAEKTTDLTIKGQLALIAAIEAGGRRLGLLEQPTGSGEEFREEFLNGAAAEKFKLPQFGEYLTNRALFGFKTLEYPSWGGLLRDELMRLEDVSASTSTGKKDFDEWLAELSKIIDQAKKAGQDLLTVYR